MAELNDIKKKFTKLLDEVTLLSNKKIGTESEIKTMETDMSELAEKLLAKTGKKDLKEAVKYFEEMSILLEEKKEKISKELDYYLSTEKEDSNELTLD